MDLHITTAIPKTFRISDDPTGDSTRIQKLEVQLMWSNIADDGAACRNDMPSDADAYRTVVLHLHTLHVRIGFQSASRIPYEFYEGRGKASAAAFGDGHAAQLESHADELVHET
jgi:hypothetical protein